MFNTRTTSLSWCRWAIHWLWTISSQIGCCSNTNSSLIWPTNILISATATPHALKVSTLTLNPSTVQLAHFWVWSNSCTKRFWFKFMSRWHYPVKKMSNTWLGFPHHSKISLVKSLIMLSKWVTLHGNWGEIRTIVLTAIIWQNGACLVSTKSVITRPRGITLRWRISILSGMWNHFWFVL